MSHTIKPQSEFPLLEKYKKYFNIKESTIFAYDNCIYANDPNLPEHLIIHESVHFDQQAEYGLNEWVDMYLHDKDFRLKMELEAYRKQLDSIADRNDKFRLLRAVAGTLSSDMYGNIVDFDEAIKLLK